MQSLPGSTLEVIETEFFFQLLVSLLANPSRLDDARQGAQVHLRRQVGEIVFLLSRYSVFADQPSLVAGQMLLTLVPDPLRRSVGNPHADCSKTSLELSFRPAAPTDGAPSGIGQHVFGCHRQDVRNVPLPGTAASGNGPDHPYIGRVYLEVPRNTDRPSKLASREPLAERRAQPIPGIRQHAAETYTSRDRPIDLRQRDLRLGPRRSIVGRYTRSLQPSLIARPTLGKKQPQRQHHRHFAARKRQRHHGLAIGGLTQRRRWRESAGYVNTLNRAAAPSETAAAKIGTEAGSIEAIGCAAA